MKSIICLVVFAVAMAKPGQLSYGTAGAGSANHLAFAPTEL